MDDGCVSYCQPTPAYEPKCMLAANVSCVFFFFLDLLGGGLDLVADDE